jgi:hypothetical protein
VSVTTKSLITDVLFLQVRAATGRTIIPYRILAAILKDSPQTATLVSVLPWSFGRRHTVSPPSHHPAIPLTFDLDRPPM